MRILIVLAVTAASVRAAMAQGLPVDTGSQIPVALWFVGAGILGIAIAYGIFRNRNRSRAERQLTNSATKDLYRREEQNR
jgi:phosphate/sulfate permease